MEAHDAPHILPVAPHAFAESGYLSYVTNTVLSTWIFLVLIAVIAGMFFFASKRKSGFLRTTGYLIVSNLKAFFEPVLGPNLPIAKTLWFVGGICLYILGANLYSLCLDWVLAFSPTTWHEYLRPINSDINTTLGMSVLVIVISHMIMIRYRGIFGYIKHYAFHFSGENFIEKCINVVVGWLHAFGELVRILSLSLRLFGNIFAGAILISVIIWMSGFLKIGMLPLGNIALVPFYLLEIFVAFIQAMVFPLLVSIYFAEASEHEAH